MNFSRPKNLSEKLAREDTKLKQLRQIELRRGIWRSLWISALAASLLWTITTPRWQINEASQVNIQGNKIFSTNFIRSLLTITYQKSIWEISTDKLTQELESHPPIAKATVTRTLFPPTLNIALKERIPVAYVISADDGKFSPNKTFFLDREGYWLPTSFYQHLKPGIKLPPLLKILGWRAEKQADWTELYQVIEKSQLKIFTVNWQDPSNLILETELGKIYLGSVRFKLAEKISVLQEMKKIPEKIPLSKIDYIDLTNPQAPTIQVLQSQDK